MPRTLPEEIRVERVSQHLPQAGRRPFFSAPALPDAIVGLAGDMDG